MSEHPDWLPPGWKIKIGVRQTGKRDKYYIDPVNKLKFNSKPEVLRYLENGGTARKKGAESKNLKNVDTTNHSPIKVEIKKTVAEDLPPGWIKEIRTKRNGCKTRSDPCYIDPASGRHFRSMQEVFRYLESKPKGKEDHSQSSSSGTKRQRLVNKKEDKCMGGDESSKSGFKGTIADDASVIEAKPVKPREEEEEQEEDDNDDSGARDLREKLQLVNGKEEEEEHTKGQNRKFAGSEVGKNDTAGRGLNSDGKGASTKNVNPPDANDHGQSVEDESVAVVFSDKLSLVNKVEPHEDCMVQNGKSADNEVDESVSGELPDIQKQEEIEKTPKQKRRSTSKTLGDLPRRTSKRLAKIEADQSVELKSKDEGQSVKSCDEGSSNETEKPKTVNSDDDSKGGEKQELPIDTSFNDLLKDPCIEFAIKTLTGAIPLEDMNKINVAPTASSLPSFSAISVSTSELPHRDVWADPCFEFAVKTLTSEAPPTDVWAANLRFS